MTFTIEVTRPDDLLRLVIEARNLKRVRSGGDGPALVVDDAAQPAFLSVISHRRRSRRAPISRPASYRPMYRQGRPHHRRLKPSARPACPGR